MDRNTNDSFGSENQNFWNKIPDLRFKTEIYNTRVWAEIHIRDP